MEQDVADASADLGPGHHKAEVQADLLPGGDQRPEGGVVAGEGELVVTADGGEFSGQAVGADQGQLGAGARGRGRAPGGVADEHDAAGGPGRHVHLRAGVEVEAGVGQGRVEQFPGPPARLVRERIPHQPLVRGDVPMVVVQRRGAEGEVRLGLGVVSRPVDPGHPARRIEHRDRAVLAERGVGVGEGEVDILVPDELPLRPEGQPPHVRVHAVGADDQVKAPGGRLLEGDGHPVVVLLQPPDGVAEQDLRAGHLAQQSH